MSEEPKYLNYASSQWDETPSRKVLNPAYVDDLEARLAAVEAELDISRRVGVELTREREAAEATLARELRLANQQHEESIVTISDLLKQLEVAEAERDTAVDQAKYAAQRVLEILGQETNRAEAAEAERDKLKSHFPYVEASGHYCDGMTAAWTDAQIEAQRADAAEAALKLATEELEEWQSEAEQFMAGTHGAWLSQRRAALAALRDRQP